MVGGTSSEAVSGAQSGWVEARRSCPHLHHMSIDVQRLPTFDAPCKECNSMKENWVCLSCNEVLCGRFINGHMLSHFESTGHSLALGYRDLSVWCFGCDSYLDAQVISELRGVFDAVHLMKFGTPSTSRQ